MTKTDKISQKIKQARIEAALSQKELAYGLKLSDRTVSAYEKGRALPPVTTLKTISNLTHKPINYFIDEDITTQEDFDLQMKIKKIEIELLQIKKALKDHGLWH
ncbi:MAG TPA: helix-turn-helix transcriptional regulator [Candidatus Woesebacteria bacterium]|nr:helix-turn-helix transcriptional regulator [Candidatus Woesebacteria bacterium]